METVDDGDLFKDWQKDVNICAQNAKSSREILDSLP